MYQLHDLKITSFHAPFPSCLPLFRFWTPPFCPFLHSSHFVLHVSFSLSCIPLFRCTTNCYSPLYIAFFAVSLFMIPCLIITFSPFPLHYPPPQTHTRCSFTQVMYKPFLGLSLLDQSRPESPDTILNRARRSPRHLLSPHSPAPSLHRLITPPARYLENPNRVQV